MNLISKSLVKIDFVGISSWKMAFLSFCLVFLLAKSTTVTCHTSGWPSDKREHLCDSLAEPSVLSSPAHPVPIALTEHGGKPVRPPPAPRAGPLLTETVNHPSS